MTGALDWLWGPCAPSAAAVQQRTVTRRGRTLRMDVIDVLRADPELHLRVRAQMLEIQSSTFATARHAGADEASGAARLASYVEDALDTTTHGWFNTAVMFFDGDRPVGCVHAFVGLVNVAGRRVEIIHTSSNVLPQFQCLGLTVVGFTRAALLYARRHLFAPHPRFNLQLNMSPVTYYFTHRRARCVYPSHRNNAPESMRALYRELCPATPHGTAVEERVGSRLEGRTREWITTSTDPAIRFYLRHNPRFEEGFGLPVLVRLETADFVHALWTSARLALTKLRSSRSRHSRTDAHASVVLPTQGASHGHPSCTRR
ncbi:MAG: hypothetical protein K0V04_16500 [Deltaproteobacteria bacterium]|nr:hypothetical protein [Deltaproteobacteria bacterium]